MTTWIFNVLRELLVQEKLQYLWIEPNSKEEETFVSCSESVLAKCHHYSPRLAKSADIVIYSYRDLRTTAVSYYRKFKSPYQRELIQGWIDAGRKWLPSSNLVLRYEEVEKEPVAAIVSIRKMLAERIGFLEFSLKSDGEIQNQIEQQFLKKQQDKEIRYDVTTMILPDHRTFQPIPQNLIGEDKTIYDQVEKDFTEWLAVHDYISRGKHGQGVEYQIAADFIKSAPTSIVVDIGAECGSYSNMALSAGAGMVILFEYLPRHIEYLQRRFKGNNRIVIHPLAISDKSGSGILHGASDTEGKELDFHHTLSDVGDPRALFRGDRNKKVKTASLGDLFHQGVVPKDIFLLKIDTDGDDLAVLKGMGDLRPKIIMAKYWDTLPETSGKNPYTLKDLADWASLNGYSKRLTIRRNDSLELVEADSIWSQAGDWGSVFFFRKDLETSIFDELWQRHAREKWTNLLEGNSRLLESYLAKEVEIRRLDAALQELRKHHELEERDLRAHMEAKEVEIRRLDHAVKDLRLQAEAKEEQIRLLDQAISELRNSIEGERQALQEQQQKKEALLAGIRQEQEQMQREYQSRIQLKETLIQEQSHALKAYHLLTQIEEKENLLEQIRSYYEQKRLQMEQQLQEKERVITELDRALRSYRSAFRLFRPLLLPWRQTKNLVRSILRPRLGTLNQHPARELILPASYGRQISLNSPPKISLVTPSFRQADFLERTLKSVLDQKYPNLEYFVQDGGSEDGTTKILTRYSDHLAGWQSAPDGGQSYAINLGFAKTSGEIMAWLNSDDILLPGSLFYIADFFQRHPKVDVVYGHRFLIDESDRLIGRWMLPPHDNNSLSWADFVPQETLFWRRRIWEKVGGKVDESFQFAIDWDLLLRFRDAGAVFHRLPRFLGGFRVHSQQKTSAEIGKVGFEEMACIRRRLHGQEPTPIEIRKALLPYLSKHIFIDLLWRIRRTVGLHY